MGNSKKTGQHGHRSSSSSSASSQSRRNDNGRPRVDLFASSGSAAPATGGDYGSGGGVHGGLDGLLEDVSLDGSVVQALGHLVKRDEMTKLRALRTLIDFCKGFELKEEDENRVADDSCIHGIASVFINQDNYRRLSLDISSRIRIHSHELLYMIATRLRKGFQKYMKKSLFTMWNATFDDDVSEVAKIATQAFEKLFATSQKRTEAIMLSHKEYLEQLHQVPTVGLFFPKCSDEDVEDILIRSVSCAVKGFANALQSIHVYAVMQQCDSHEAKDGSIKSTNKSGTSSQLCKYIHSFDSTCLSFIGSKHDPRTRLLTSMKGEEFTLMKCINNPNPRIRRAAYAFVSTTFSLSVSSLGHNEIDDNICHGHASFGSFYDDSGTVLKILESLGERESSCIVDMFEMVLKISRHEDGIIWSKQQEINKRILPKLW